MQILLSFKQIPTFYGNNLKTLIAFSLYLFLSFCLSLLLAVNKLINFFSFFTVFFEAGEAIRGVGQWKSRGQECGGRPIAPNNKAKSVSVYAPFVTSGLDWRRPILVRHQLLQEAEILLHFHHNESHFFFPLFYPLFEINLI